MAIVATAFANASRRSDHWSVHRLEFPEIADEEAYERKAVEFMNAVIDPGKVYECVRTREGDTIRYEPATENFAVMRADGKIRTFFRPNVAGHGLASNLAYFQSECAKK